MNWFDALTKSSAAASATNPAAWQIAAVQPDAEGWTHLRHVVESWRRSDDRAAGGEVEPTPLDELLESIGREDVALCEVSDEYHRVFKLWLRGLAFLSLAYILVSVLATHLTHGVVTAPLIADISVGACILFWFFVANGYRWRDRLKLVAARESICGDSDPGAGIMVLMSSRAGDAIPRGDGDLRVLDVLQLKRHAGPGRRGDK